MFGFPQRRTDGDAGRVAAANRQCLLMRATSPLRRVLPQPVKLAAKRLLEVIPGASALVGPAFRRPTTLIDATDTAAVHAFVVRSDEFGGPDAAATKTWWQTVRFDVPTDLRVEARRLAPLSPDYLALQDRLYVAMAGSPYQPTISELTPFDKDAAAAGRLAYPFAAPQDLNRHMSAMARMVDQFDRSGALCILELGSGWGFACEYLARLGHTLVGVDVNPDFIETASRRSARQELGIDYRLGTFERLPVAPDERFDVIFTSAALHHSRTPFAALHGMVAHLVPRGQVILGSEPFIDTAVWPAWGLRTDPLSVYCIARFGWWESGWTRDFMAELFARASLDMRFADYHTDLERYMVGCQRA